MAGHRRILNTAQMRAVDRRTIDELGVPSAVLMENAGRQVVATLAAAVDDLSDARVSVLCGTGNNGGDGFVVARVLAERGVDVSVYLLGSTADVRGDARVYLDVFARLGGHIVSVPTEVVWDEVGAEAVSADVIVDAIVGTGLSRPLAGLHATVVADVNASDATVVAVDLPSGLSADTAAILGPAVVADVTVALAALKVPLVLSPAAQCAGTVSIGEIGIPTAYVDAADGPRMWLLTRASVAALLPPRPVDMHKGDAGRVLIVGGSRGLTGAPALSAMGALHGGAGLVTVAVPASVQAVVAAAGVEYMTLALPDTASGTVSAAAVDVVLSRQADVIALGPGLGAGPDVTAFVEGVLARATCPLVVDADALNALASAPERLAGRPGRPVVITPHPGEMARLLGRAVDEVQVDRVEVARTFATTHGVYVVLKGHRTLVAEPDGTVSVNPTGTSGMATGGSGDVLTGVVATWLAAGLAPATACQLAVYGHGLAGELAAGVEGDIAMTATDIVRHLGAAWRALSEGAGAPSTE